jgi:glycosyltransferase involved in cell wall biosynthesis
VVAGVNRIALFVYFYDAARPEADEPLGGTTSAICFLAREMVKAGISCTFFNRVDEPRAAHGIQTLPLQALSENIGRDAYDAYIFCGRWSEELVQLIRAHTRAPLIAWMHESTFAPPMTPACAAFDGVVFVSEWQRRVNRAAALPHWKQAVIRNAMNPAVAASFPTGDILPAKTEPPLLLFAGSFVRGAFHIPPLVEKLRAKRGDFTVELFCNLNPSRDEQKDAAYIGWMRGLPHIAHVGMVSQTELAARMRRASVLIAPNPWPETSCIALIEALASGMMAVATARAALPETAADYAQLISIEAPDDPLRFDMPIDYDAFADAIDTALRGREHEPQQTEQRLREQVDYFQTYYQWQQRVAPWIAFIEDLKAK